MEYIQCLVNLLIMIQPIYREQMIANNDRIFYSINFIKYNIIFYQFSDFEWMWGCPHFALIYFRINCFFVERFLVDRLRSLEHV